MFGWGLLLLTEGAFLRFVVGRYAAIAGAYDIPGSVLMFAGALCLAGAVVGAVRSGGVADSALPEADTPLAHDVRTDGDARSPLDRVDAQEH